VSSEQSAERERNNLNRYGYSLPHTVEEYSSDTVNLLLAR